MRKRRFVCGIALCLALSVAGCGKSSEEKQAAKYYQDELGLDKEDADALAHELYGKDEEAPGVPEGGSQKSEVEPLPELVNSEWYDRKVQIYDMVFTRDEYLTEEVIRKTVEESAYDFELSEDFDENGDVRLTEIVLDGKTIVQLRKRSRRDFGVDVGFFEKGDYYGFYDNVHEKDNCYEKAVMEIEDLGFKTRDDVLAYLAEYGFVEVERSPYGNLVVSSSEFSMYPYVRIDAPGTAFVDMPHYCSNGEQSIRFYRVHRRYEPDEPIQMEDGTYIHTGFRLNLYQKVILLFNTDGTIAAMSPEVGEALILGGAGALD